MTFKRVFAFFAVFVFTVLALICTSDAPARADMAVETDFYLSAEQPDGYFNAVDGCVYRIPIKQSAYSNFIRAEYTVVRLNGISDVVTTDDENNITSSQEIIRTATVLKSELSAYANPTINKYRYFEVTAYEWCAFVFTVYYNGTNGEAAAYGSEIIYCVNIDSSAPEAYYTGWVYRDGGYVFSVVVHGNTTSDVNTANSGLKAFTVLKYANGAYTQLDEVTNIGNTFYNYQLTADKGKAAYYLDIIDNAGNGSRVLIVEFTETSYNADFESAVENTLANLKSNSFYADFSDGLYNSLSEAYYSYYLLIQDVSASESDIKEAQNACYDIMKYIALLKEMKNEGKKETVVVNLNTEYLGGDITLGNAGYAFGSQKYGEVAYYTLSVAQYDLSRVDRKEAMAFLGISGADTLYTLSLSLALGTVSVETAFDEALEVILPVEFKDVAAVQTVTLADGTTERYELNVVYGNGSTVIFLPYTYGTVDIFVGEKVGFNLLWLILIVPLSVAAVALAVVFAVKRVKLKKIDSEKNI